MKAPDKIYLLSPKEGQIGNIAFEEPILAENFGEQRNIAYIREDALLEWAKGEIMPGNSAEGKGWNLAIQTLIDKIESL